MRTYHRLRVRLPKRHRDKIESLLSSGIQPVRVLLRALALRQLHQGKTAAQVAPTVNLTAKGVRDIGRRYEEKGLDRALYDKHRPGAAPLLDMGERQRIIAMVCGNPPVGFARWTVRLVAEEAVKRKMVPKVGRETIRILLQHHDFKPWREKMWCVPELTDEYIEKMEDVLATYEKPLNPDEPVVCFDEKPISLHAEVRPAEPAEPGKIAKRDSEWERCGTANVFCAVEPKAGAHFTIPTPDRSAAEFAQAIVKVASQYPAGKTIHLVMDNLNIHRKKSLTDYYGEAAGSAIWDRFTVHYTPKHGSWLNQAEIEIGIFSKQCLGTRRIPALKTLRREAQAWNRHVNRARLKINWTFDRKAARKKFRYHKHSFKRSRN